MNIEEARKVLWLKSNPRPLGELLDEGYLTQERLEWAAKRAYNSKLQQAAKVLIEAGQNSPRIEQELLAQNSFEIGISLKEAREIYWPFNPYKGQPMGSLVESKQLSLKDLGYAIENAWDEKVRQAAMALTLFRLKQTIQEPAPSAGYVKIVDGGRSYANRMQSYLTLVEGFILGIFSTLSISICVFWLINSYRPNPNSTTLAEIVSTPTGIVALIIIFVGLIVSGWLINLIPDQITKRFEKQIEEHRRGEEGEERTIQMIIQALDGNWHLFRNVQLPGRNRGDLDIVLVGPPGVWVLEVKNFRGKYRNIGDLWEYRKNNQWKTMKMSPSQQAFKNAIRLKDFLRADNLKVFVNAVVVWANEESHLMVENPSTSVWTYNRLPDELGNIWQGEKLSAGEREKIVEKLSKQCEMQKKEDEKKR